MKTVADAVVEQLAAWGVRHVFGVPGSSLVPFLSALKRHPIVKFVATRHEETAALMASAAAKLTGGLGVCLAHAGPGAAHLVNGLYDAHEDRVPVVAVTGQVPRAKVGTDYKQATDQNAMFSGCAGRSAQVDSPAAAVELVASAMRYAVSARDAAHVALPLDVQAAPFEGSPRAAEPYLTTPPRVEPEALHQSAALLHSARRPLILAGRGAAKAGKDVAKLARRLGAPLATTLFAKGSVSEDESLAVGVLGEAGTDHAAEAARRADAVILLGCTWWPRQYMPEDASVLQVDVRPDAVGAGKPVAVGVVARCEDVLPELLRHLPEGDREPWFVPGRGEGAGREGRAERSAVPSGTASADGVGARADGVAGRVDGVAGRVDGVAACIHPGRVIEAVRAAVPPDAVVALDTGLTTLWYGRAYRSRQETTLVSGRWRTMGFGLPAAMAAACLAPGRRAVALCGDGGFTMSLADLATAVKYEWPVVAVVFRNGLLGEEAAKQERAGAEEFGMHLAPIDFAAVARAMGAQGLRVDAEDELEPALARAMRDAQEARRPAVVDVATAYVPVPALVPQRADAEAEERRPVGVH